MKHFANYIKAGYKQTVQFMHGMYSGWEEVGEVCKVVNFTTQYHSMASCRKPGRGNSRDIRMVEMTGSV